MIEKDKKDLSRLREDEFLRACRESGVTPGMAKALVQSDFTDLAGYRKWKKRLKE